MQGRRSLGRILTLADNNINQIRRLREHLRKVAEENNLVPIEIEEGTEQRDQTMTAGGGR